MKFTKQSKVSKHTQTQSGKKYKTPRIVITGKDVEKIFEIGEKILVKFDTDEKTITVKKT